MRSVTWRWRATRRRGIVLAGVVALAGFATVTWERATAPEFGRDEDGYVHDAARLISDRTEDEIETALRDFRRVIGKDVVVVTEVSLDGMTKEAVAHNLAKEWSMFDRARPDGVLLMVAREEWVWDIYLVGAMRTDPARSSAVLSIARRTSFADDIEVGNYDEALVKAVAYLTRETSGGRYRASISAYPGQNAFSWARAGTVAGVAATLVAIALARDLRSSDGPGSYSSRRRGELDHAPPRAW